MQTFINFNCFTIILPHLIRKRQERTELRNERIKFKKTLKSSCIHLHFYPSSNIFLHRVGTLQQHEVRQHWPLFPEKTFLETLVCKYYRKDIYTYECLLVCGLKTGCVFPLWTHQLNCENAKRMLTERGQNYGANVFWLTKI